MKITICKNTSEKKFGYGKLPINQHLFWLGGIFILVNLAAKYRLGYVIGLGGDNGKMIASINPNYKKWAELVNIHKKYFMFYIFLMEC